MDEGGFQGNNNVVVFVFVKDLLSRILISLVFLLELLGFNRGGGDDKWRMI